MFVGSWRKLNIRKYCLVVLDAGLIISSATGMGDA